MAQRRYERPASGRGGGLRLVGAAAVVFAATVVATTAAKPWHPAQLVVYAYCAGFALVAGWWLPARAVHAARSYARLLRAPAAEAATLRTASRVNAGWTMAVGAGVFGGLLLFLAVGSLR